MQTKCLVSGNPIRHLRRGSVGLQSTVIHSKRCKLVLAVLNLVHIYQPHPWPLIIG